MKKISIIIIVCSMSFVSYAQEEEKPTELSKLTKKIDDISSKINNYKTLQDKNSSDINEVQAKISNILKDKNKIDDYKKKEVQKRVDQILKSTDFVKAAYHSFKSVEVSLDQSDVMNEITKINNPTNEELGFSIKETIKRLFKEHLSSNVGDDNEKSNKVNSFVDNILNNPITNAVKSLVPTVNTVIGFISNLSFNSKKVTTEQLDKFLKDLNKYMVVYDGLATATQNFETQIQQIKIKSKSLEMILQSYVTDRIAGFDTPSDTLDMVVKKFTREIIQKKITEIEENNKTDLDNYNDNRLNQSLTSISQARYIQDELENLYNQYLNVQKIYLKDITDVLQKSIDLKGSNEKNIKEKIKELNAKHDSWALKFENLVNIKDLKIQVKDLSKNNN